MCIGEDQDVKSELVFSAPTTTGFITSCYADQLLSLTDMGMMILHLITLKLERRRCDKLIDQHNYNVVVLQCFMTLLMVPIYFVHCYIC